MTIWMPVMFKDELDMLEMKLEETAAWDVRHVLVEAELTHRGYPKPQIYQEHAERFGRHADRITHVVADLSGIAQPWAREHAQRDAAWPVIDADAADGDLVVIGDLDEFPSAAAMAWTGLGAVSLYMRTTLFAVDWLIPESCPLPPTCVMATAGWLRQMRAKGLKLGDVRDRRGDWRAIPAGGWHFSWTGGPAAQREKLQTATCHTELLGTEEGGLIADGERYRTSQDGGGLPVVPAEVDQSWPQWIWQRKCPPEWFRPRGPEEPPAVAPVRPVATARRAKPTGMSVMLTCWRRPYYFGPVLESWARACEVHPPDRVVIAIGRTDRTAEQLDLIAKMAPAFPVPLEFAWQSSRAEFSPGPHRAIGEAGRALFADGAKFAVFGEEDVAVSDDVLGYMDWVRRELRGHPDVLAACAHNQHGQGWDTPGSGQAPDADQSAVRLLPYFNPWIWGTWRDRWEQVMEPSWDWECNSGGPTDSGYDWAVCRMLAKHQMTCAVPDAARSQNIGREEGWAGSSDPVWFAATQTATFREARGKVTYRLESPNAD